MCKRRRRNASHNRLFQHFNLDFLLWSAPLNSHSVVGAGISNGSGLRPEMIQKETPLTG
jgi:hypothetical protein